MMKVLDTLIQFYNSRGFKIIASHGDNEFNIQTLKYFLLPELHYIYGKYQHVGIIERSTRTVKELCRVMCH